MAAKQIERDIKYAHTHRHTRIAMEMHVQALELTLNFDKRTRLGRVPRVATTPPQKKIYAHTHRSTDRTPARPAWPKNQQLRQQDDNLFSAQKG